MRLSLSVVALSTVLGGWGHFAAVAGDEIISEGLARRYGLTRMWVTQAQVNPGQGKLDSVTLYDKTLFVQSSRATIEAIDAESGRKIWSKMVGRPDLPSLPPGAAGDLVATINGSRLFVLNRYTGDILYETTINGAPGGGPALSGGPPNTVKRAYVPTVSGMIYAYRLDPITDPAKELGKIDPNAANMTDEEKKEAARRAEEERRENIRIRQDYIPPLACNSSGRALAPPLITMQTRDEEYSSWVTDRGYLYVGRIDLRSNDLLLAKFRLATNGTCTNPPAYLPPDPKVLGDSGTVFVGSSDGYIYAVQENTGVLLWKFPAADPVIDSPIIIENRLYATTELGGLFCLNVKTGKQIWWAPEILHFVAAGKQRVYASDKLGRLRILDARSGSTLDTLPTSNLPVKVSNGQTDRIYLGTANGMLQCLREIELTDPIVYNESRKPAPEADEPKAAAKPKPKPGNAGGHKAPGPAPAKKPKKDDAGLGDGGNVDKAAKPAPAKPDAGKGKAKDAEVENPFGGPG